jgi:hypothetical protein
MVKVFRILLWVFAAIGLAGTLVTTMLAIGFHDMIVAGAKLPDINLGSSIAQRLRGGTAVAVQGIGEGGWTKACLVRAYMWSEAEHLMGIEQPYWWENEGLATLVLADDRGRILYVPFLRSDMDIAEKHGYCAMTSADSRLVLEDGSGPVHWVRLQ